MTIAHGQRLTLASWEWFESRTRPILEQYLKRDGQTPTTLRLMQDGQAWLCSASGLHGGYHAVLMRMEMPLPGKPPLKEWSELEKRARPVIQGYVTATGHPPTTRQLFRDGHAWIPRAAWNYCNGYEAMLKKMGFVPRPLPQTGSGLSRPDVFAAEFVRAVTLVRDQVHHTPSRREMEQAGFRGLMAACHRAHGGYVNNLRRFGFTPRGGQVRLPTGYWHTLQTQRQTLERHFPTYLELSVMPPCTIIRRKFPGLVRFWNTRGITWPQVAKRFGLMDWKAVGAQVRYLRAVQEALSFYQKKGRWPKSNECPHRVRDTRYRNKTSWEACLTRTDLHLSLQKRLVEIWRTHLRWIEQHQPQHTPARRACLNRLVMALNQRIPAPRE